MSYRFYSSVLHYDISISGIDRMNLYDIVLLLLSIKTAV